MRLRKRNRSFLVIFAFAFGLWQGSLGEAFGQNSAVSFVTEDGWKLTGSLYMPKQTSNHPIPAVVLLTEPGWVDRSIYDTYLAQELAEVGIAALNFDLRGTGTSLGKKYFEEFSSKDLEGIQLDVGAAIEFLSSLPMVDSSRIGVVGAGLSSEYAVLEAAENSKIQALVLISGSLSKKAKEYLQLDHSVPVLGVVGKDDKKSFLEVAEAYAISTNRSSDLLLAVGHGAVMFSHTQGLEEKVVSWMEHNLKTLGTEIEVSFQSEDWGTLYGTLRLPGGLDPNTKVPGVVLVHGAKHDQQTYHFMAREIAKQGIATLRFDWRGKGKSANGGRMLDQSKVFLDVKAAIQFLASQPSVDSNRIGAVAATLACVHTLQASLGDPRVKTIVLLTSLEPNEEAKRFLTTSDVPIFAIASSEDNNYQRGSLAESTRQVYLLSSSKQSEFLLYDDAGRGSEMLKVKSELQPMILRWLGDKLQGIIPTQVNP